MDAAHAVRGPASGRSPAVGHELTGKGVNFPEPPSKQFFGWWSMFEDPDGTRYALGQTRGA